MPSPPTPPPGTRTCEHGDATSRTQLSEKVGDVVDGALSAASEARAAAGEAADAAVDAAKAATASIKDVADDVDFDSLVAHTKTVAADWTDKLKQTYRERPGVVIAADVGAVR